MDIKSFFTSIDQDILYGLLTKKIKNEEVLWLAKVIIFHDCAHDILPKIQSQPSLFDKLPKDKSLFTVKKGKGLPIGNLTSQFFANVYMNELDQYVKHTLKVKYYLRYVDDFIILDLDRKKLEYLQCEINKFLREKLSLIAHPGKQFIRTVSSGIDFVGYIVRPEYVLVRKRIVYDWRRRIENFPEISPKKRKQTMASCMAHASFANCVGLEKKMKQLELAVVQIGASIRSESSRVINFSPVTIKNNKNFA